MNRSPADISSTSPEPSSWDLYLMLVELLRHNHSRWIENYRVFLSFNAFLLPASTALLAYVFKDGTRLLAIFVFILSLVGIVATRSGFGFIRRVATDTQMRLNQIRRAEDAIEGLPLRPFREGGGFFFGELAGLPAPVDGRPLLLAESDLGLRSYIAYQRTSRAIQCAYFVLAAVSVGVILLPFIRHFMPATVWDFMKSAAF